MVLLSSSVMAMTESEKLILESQKINRLALEKIKEWQGNWQSSDAIYAKATEYADKKSDNVYAMAKKYTDQKNGELANAVSGLDQRVRLVERKANTQPPPTIMASSNQIIDQEWIPMGDGTYVRGWAAERANLLKTIIKLQEENTSLKETLAQTNDVLEKAIQRINELNTIVVHYKTFIGNGGTIIVNSRVSSQKTQSVPIIRATQTIPEEYVWKESNESNDPYKSWKE